MKPKCEIGVSLQGSKRKRSQEFGLGAARNRNVQSYGHMLKIRSDCLLEARDRVLSARDYNVLIASAVECNSLLGYN